MLAVTASSGRRARERACVQLFEPRYSLSDLEGVRRVHESRQMRRELDRSFKRSELAPPLVLNLINVLHRPVCML